MMDKSLCAELALSRTPPKIPETKRWRGQVNPGLKQVNPDLEQVNLGSKQVKRVETVKYIRI
jgi:hypothetical protein